MRKSRARFFGPIYLGVHAFKYFLNQQWDNLKRWLLLIFAGKAKARVQYSGREAGCSIAHKYYTRIEVTNALAYKGKEIIVG
jgi:hypothetical protein